jgi:hypothetical protein
VKSNIGTRESAGLYKIDLPIRNESASVLDVTCPLNVTSASASKTAGYSIDQEGGRTIIENGTTLTVGKGFLMKAGSLNTYGTAQCTISLGTGSIVNVQGGTMNFANNLLGAYGSLAVFGGDMSWTGGTFVAWVDGQNFDNFDSLKVVGNLSLGSGAHLEIHVNGALTQGFNYYPVSVGGGGNKISGTLSFDSGNLFNIYYEPQPPPDGPFHIRIQAK